MLLLVPSFPHRKYQDPTGRISQTQGISPAIVRHLHEPFRDHDQQTAETGDHRDNPTRKAKPRTPL